jgi:hypothetical protein
VPVLGQLLLPEQVNSIDPPVRDREVVAWLPVDEPRVAIVAEVRWSVRVVGWRGGTRSGSPDCPPNWAVER